MVAVERSSVRLAAAALIAGLAISAAMIPLAQAGGDQLNLLARGWLLAARGELVPFGNPLSSGAKGIGALTSVVVGAPLALWTHHRAPIVLIWLCHGLALWLLDRTLRSSLAPVERAAFAVLLVLGPWRVEAAATLWNPNYLLLVGAVHLATAVALARRGSFGVTFVHVLALGLGAQLHPSVLLLGVLSTLLWARGYVRVSWTGFAAGVAATLATLVPWLAAVLAHPALAQPTEGFLFRGFAYLFPLLKGLAYWLRYPSLAIRHESARFDFAERLGAGVDAWLTPAALGLLAVAGAATLGFAIWANFALVRSRGASLLRRWPGEGGERRWLEGYASLAFVAAVVVFGASPTTPQSWQAFPLFHAAALPVAWGVGRVAARWGSARALAGVAVAGVVALTLDLAVALGAPAFRCGGRGDPRTPLRSSSPMFEELGLQGSCPWLLDQPGGWWPDVLPEEPE